MFLVVKLFSHSSTVYVSITILLLWTTLKQHQNYSKPKASKNPKLPFSQTSYSSHHFVQIEGPFKVTNTSLNTNQKGNYSRNFLRETTQEAS
jgi:hypothetical protein